VAVEGIPAICPPPAQKQTASAPPTPLHPEGTPRALTPSGEFPGPPGSAVNIKGSVSLTEGWMRGAHGSASEAASSAALLRQSPSPPPDAGLRLSLDAPATEDQKPFLTSSVTHARASGGREAGAGFEGIASPSGEGMNLDVPLEEVLTQSTEAFGQIATSLSSTKWDRRVQALKGITAVIKGMDIKVNSPSSVGVGHALSGDSGAAMAASGAAEPKGLQLRDHARCFHASCLILHIAMRDKVLPVMSAAHELYRVTFDLGRGCVPEDEACAAMTTLFQHLLVKLGELNIRLHESACACVVFSARQPFFGLARVIARLQGFLDDRGVTTPTRGLQAASVPRGPQRLRVHSGVLSVVAQLLRHFPGRREGEGDATDAVGTWSPSDINPFIISGLAVDAVTGARVQQAAVGIGLTVCTTLGKASLKPVVAQLSPAGQELLVSRLEEEGEDWEDDELGEEGDECIELTGADSLCVLGVGLKPQPGWTKPSMTTVGEECFMDSILEETGLVFEGQSLGPKLYKTELDEELSGLGLDQEGLLS